MVFLPFSPVSLTELCSFWYGLKDLFTLHALADKVALVHRLMTSQAVEGTWIRTGGSGANGLSWTIFLWYLLVGYLVGELRGCLTTPFSLYGSVHSDRATFNFVDHPVTVNILFSECNANGVLRRMIRVSFWFPLYLCSVQEKLKCTLEYTSAWIVLSYGRSSSFSLLWIATFCTGLWKWFFLLPISGFFCFAIVFCYMVTLFSSVWLDARLSNQKLKNRDRTVPSSVSSDVRDSLGLTISRGHVVWASLCRPAVSLGYFSKTSW